MLRLRRHGLNHERARSWLSERLDAPLPATREAALEAHLEACAACRQVDAEYRANRAALRQLAAPVPPRDLPARTLAALEVEARHVRRPRAAPVLQQRGARRSGGVAVGSLLTVALVAIVGALLVGPVVQISGPSAGATPFAITPVDLAFIGIQNDVVRLYRTRLDHACPSGNTSCAAFGPQVDQIVWLPRTAALSALTLDPAGRRAALAARPGISTTTTYYVVDLGGGGPWPTGPSSMYSTGASPSPTVASPSTAPSRTPGPASHARADTAATTNGPAGGTKTAVPTAHASPSSRAARSPAAARSATPRPTASARPTAASVAGAGPTSPTASGGAAGPLAGASSPPAAASGLPAGASNAPGVATLPPVQAQPILQDVIPTGAPAAWSPDGGTLAFSAMPADASTGSDIYIWRPGDVTAVAITTDHASSFASWAGDRIVGSDLVPDTENPNVLTPQSFVLDPRTGERRPIIGAPLWLPSVDPDGQYAVAWSGTLQLSGLVPVPDHGQLVFLAWRALDPFALPSTPPTGTAVPFQVPPPVSVAPSRASHGSSGGSPAPSRTTTPVGSPSVLPFWAQTPQPLAASPQPSSVPLQDWLVEWSPDGSAFGLWEGPAVGVEVGTLALHAIDQVNGQLDTASLLMGPVPARRAFSIGLDRLVWATPPNPHGLSELRVLVWGSFGRGELHSRQLDQQEIVPAF